MKTAKKFVETALQWKGKKESDGSFKEIIDVYNSFTPRPRGYKVQYTDEWCATFVSAVAIKCGYTDIIPPECGCERMLEQFKALGAFIENENRVPNIGDICFYDWQDVKDGDCVGWSDHVGIVIDVSRETFTVLEGNYGKSVKERVVNINAPLLRGFAVPKFEKESDEMATYYTVQKGDTLSKIANKFRTTVEAIRKSNAETVKDVNVIGVGWVLKIPVSEGSEKPYEEIGRAFEKCWNDVENLDSYKKLMELLGE